MSIMPQEKCILRKMVKSDLLQMYEIEQVTQGAPWTEDTFNTCFEQGYEGWVMEAVGRVVGYLIVGMQVDECHILNLCVALPYQRQGLGLALLQTGLVEAKKRNIAIAYLEVRRSNTRAIGLYTRLHFRLIGERKDYYRTVGGTEDALIYAVSLHDSSMDSMT